MAAHVDLEFATETKPVYREHRPGPMRILVLGDFSGRANRGILEHGVGLADRPLSPIDVDSFETNLFRFAPRLHLPAGGGAGPGMVVEFKCLEDFHPDALFDKLELFQGLRRQRARLADPATFPQAAAELKHSIGEPLERAPEEGGRQPSGPPAEEDSSTLERLLGKRPADLSRPGPSPAARLDLDGIIRRIVEPHIVPGADPQQAQFVSAVDAGIGDQMRDLIHHRAFQELEAVWRSVHGLVTGVETGEDLQLFLLDVSKEEIAADVAAADDDPRESGLHRSVVERAVRTPGGQPWSLLIGSYTFGPGPGEIGLLEALGRFAAEAGAPFLAAADPAILGCDSLGDFPDPGNWRQEQEHAERWLALRKSPAASWLGLVLPRLLLRLPYGASGEEIDRFAFEELGARPDHAAFLWGNGAFGCARLIAQAFLERGWSMEPGDFLDVDGLPAYVYDDGDERKLKPCAEVLLSERAGTAILEHGIMPLLSYRDRNAARLLRFQSVAAPSKGLPGPWSQS
jgi:type VI secretion system protein ImpC